MNKTVAIDVAAKSEWDEVLSVTKAAYSEYGENSDKQFWQAYQQSIERTVMTDDSVIRLVAKDNAKILASVLFCPPYEKKMGSSFVSTLAGCASRISKSRTGSFTDRLLRGKGPLRRVSNHDSAYHGADANGQANV